MIRALVNKIFISLFTKILVISSISEGYHSDIPFSKISEGVRATIKELPFVVRLVIGPNICTGTIIGNSWVLTAAHCINRHWPMQIYAGIDNLNQIDGQIRKPRIIIQHPAYLPNKLGEFDLAVIELEHPFELSEKVAILKLSADEWPKERMYNRSCLAAGWGLIPIKEEVSNVLMKVNVLARHGDIACRCAIRDQKKRIICLTEVGTGICDGDIGGALICDKKGVGVAHIIYKPDKCEVIEIPGAAVKCESSIGTFMYICPFLNWIRKIVPDVPKTPSNCRGSSPLKAKLLIIITFMILHLLPFVISITS